MVRHLGVVLVGVVLLAMILFLPVNLEDLGAESAHFTRTSPSQSPLPTPAPRIVYVPVMRRGFEETGAAASGYATDCLAD